MLPYSEYEKAYLEYKNRYGDKMAVFMKIGSRFEMFDSIDPKTNESACNCREIIECMGIRSLIREGDAPHGRDGLFSGVLRVICKEYLRRLIDDGWTIIIVDTIKDDNSMIRCGRGRRYRII